MEPPALPWGGRATPFTIEPCDDAPFDRRLVLPERRHGCWIVLTYRTDPLARPLRPMVRLVRTGGSEDFLLPGVVLGVAHWLGRLPRDLTEIRIAAEPGFVLERVGLRSDANAIAECALKQPSRLPAALYTRLTGDERRFRNTVRAACAITPLAGYAGWKAARERPPAADDPAGGLSVRLILSAEGADAALVAQTIESLRAQTHEAWRLLISCDDEAAAAVSDDTRIEHTPPPSSEGERFFATSLAHDGDAFGILHPGDRLTPDALAILARALASPEAPDLVYADEDIAGSTPRLKPDWSPDLALVTGYTGRPTLFSRAVLALIDAAQGDGLDGLILAALSAARRVAHIPRILCTVRPDRHSPARPTSNPIPHPEVRGAAERRRSPRDSAEATGGLLRGPLARASQDEDESGIGARAALLDRQLARIGSPARAEVVDGVLDLRWPVPDPPPLASIVIPSRDRPDLIGRITHDVLHRTDYPAIELVVVDNGSADPAVLTLYDELRADPRVQIVPFPHPFDFAAMVNAGAAASQGAVLIFLNNDIAVEEPSWLAALVGQAVRPEVGAVGAKLLYGDGTLQHAGVVIGIGGRSGHILRRKPGDTPGHLGRLKVAHEVSAVTAACLAVERQKFEAVGGFDQKTFPIDFNDADLCLRLSAKGWKTVWTPRASLLHLESVSRGPPSGAARARFEREGDAFAARWRDVVRHDPYHHPAFTLTGFDEALE